MKLAGLARAFLAGHVTLMSLAPAPAADVIVVAADGSGDFTQINQALQSSSDGDALLVRSGTYAPFVVINRHVSVIADEGAVVLIHGYAAVTGLEAHKTVELAGLRPTAQMPVHHGLFLAQNEGAVRVRDCVVSGYDAPSVSHCRELRAGGGAVHIEASPDVVLTRCTVYGGDGEPNDEPFCYEYAGAGGPGVFAEGSEVVLYDCTIRGGTGGTANWGGNGGAGVWLETSWLFASGESIEGGRGGNANDIIPLCGNGGVGLFVSTGSSARILDVTIEGGEMGQHCCGVEEKCTDGLAIDGGGDVFQDPSGARSLASERVVREGSSITLQFTGIPGDQVFLLRSTQPGFRLLEAWHGVLLTGPPAALGFAPLGTIGAGGTLSIVVPAPDLAPAVEARILHLQGLFVESTTNRVLGSGAPLLVVDDVF